MENRNQARGWGQRFIAPRVNLECIPCLPAAAVAWVINDPRQVQYLMIWKEEASGTLLEAVRVSPCNDTGSRGIKRSDWVDIKRANGSEVWILTTERPLPRNGGKARLVICPRCQRPRRALYPWRLNPAKRHAIFTSIWQCRSCAQLRYASEGGALVFHPRTELGRLIEAVEGPSQSRRPAPWYPYVMVNPSDAEAIVPHAITFLYPRSAEHAL